MSPSQSTPVKDHGHIDRIEKLPVFSTEICHDGFCEETARYKIYYATGNTQVLCKKHLDKLLTPKEV